MTTTSHGTSIGYKEAVTASQALALIGLDLLTDVEFLNQVKADFYKRTKKFTYAASIPESVKESDGLPDEMRRYGTRAQLKSTILKSGDENNFGHRDHNHSHRY